MLTRKPREWNISVGGNHWTNTKCTGVEKEFGAIRETHLTGRKKLSQIKPFREGLKKDTQKRHIIHLKGHS